MVKQEDVVTIRVLFVCLGNICRSPMAEAVFQQCVNEAGLDDRIKVDSAGTGSWHVGERAHRGTLNVLRQHGIPYDGRARQISHKDFEQFDYILTMDDDNLADVRRIMPANCPAVVQRFLDFADNLSSREVPDPYYDGRFEEVYELVNQGAQGLLAHLREKQGW
jgi:protein-tyrosine phosphatase